MNATTNSTVAAVQLRKENEMQTNVFNRAVTFLSGLAMIIFPIAQMTAFAIHPQFWTFKHETGALVQYNYIQSLGWQIGHTLVYATLPLMLVAYLQVARLVGKTHPWVAIVGGLLSLSGIGFMIGNFGQVMAQGTIGLMLPKEQAIPAIQLMIDNAGMMQISFFGQIAALFGPVLLALGLIFSPQVASRWSGLLILLGNLIIIAFIDIDAYMFMGDLAILIGLLPLTLRFLKGKDPLAELG